MHLTQFLLSGNFFFINLSVCFLKQEQKDCIKKVIHFELLIHPTFFQMFIFNKKKEILNGKICFLIPKKYMKKKTTFFMTKNN